jgi:hypothetical protein
VVEQRRNDAVTCVSITNDELTNSDCHGLGFHSRQVKFETSATEARGVAGSCSARPNIAPLIVERGGRRPRSRPLPISLALLGTRLAAGPENLGIAVIFNPLLSVAGHMRDTSAPRPLGCRASLSVTDSAIRPRLSQSD